MSEELENIIKQKIAEKYGGEVLEEDFISPHKKASYLKQVKELKEKELSIYNEQELDSEQKEYVRKIIFKKNKVENCSFCSKYQIYFDINDDVSLEKYDCCYECYIKHIEGREERWQKGWRPNNE